MFNTTSPALNITVFGGTIEENQQLCSTIKAALTSQGFGAVQIEAGSEYHISGANDLNLVRCMRSINPDLFDTPIMITGESDTDMAAQAACLGFPSTAVGAWPANAFN